MLQTSMPDTMDSQRRWQRPLAIARMKTLAVLLLPVISCAGVVTARAAEDAPSGVAAVEVSDKGCSAIMSSPVYLDQTWTWGRQDVNTFNFKSCDSNEDGLAGPGEAQDWTVRALPDSVALAWCSFVAPDANTLILHPEIPVDPPGGEAWTEDIDLHIDSRRLVVGHTYRVRVENISEASGGSGAVTAWPCALTLEPISMPTLRATASDGSLAHIELSWSRVDTVGEAMTSYSVYRGDSEDITLATLGEAALVASGLASGSGSFHDDSGLAAPTSVYAVIGYYGDRGAVLISNTASIVIGAPGYTELVWVDDFEDGDVSTSPAWTIQQDIGTSVWVGSANDGLAMYIESNLQYRPRAILDAPIADHDFRLGFRAATPCGREKHVYFLDDSGRTAYLMRHRIHWVKIDVVAYDAAGDSIGITTPIDVPLTYSLEDHDYDLIMTGDVMSVYRDGAVIASGALGLPDDQWHDDITSVVLSTFYDGVSAPNPHCQQWFDDVRLAVDTGERTPAGTLEITSLAVDGEALPVAAPVIEVGQGQAVDLAVGIQYDTASATAAIRPLFLVPSWSSGTPGPTRLLAEVSHGSADTVAVDVTAPTEPGSYYLLFGVFNECCAENFASATSWLFHGDPVWGDGNDLTDLSIEEIASIQGAGNLTRMYTGHDSPVTIAAAAIRIDVTDMSAVDGTVPAGQPGFVAIYPNPFNPAVTIEFEMPGAGIASVRIYDVAGRRIRDLLVGTTTAGRHRVQWDGRDGLGRSMSSGRYFCRLHAGGVSRTRSLMLVR